MKHKSKDQDPGKLSPGIPSVLEEFKQAAEAVRKTEIEYRAIFESMGTPTALIEIDMTIIIANNEFERFSGYSREEIEGKKGLHEFLLPDDTREIKRYFNQSGEEYNAAPKNYKIVFNNKQGDKMEVVITLAMIPQLKKSVFTMADIRKIKETEESLRASEVRFRTLYNNAPVGITISREGKIQFVNQTYLKMFGYEDLTEIAGTLLNQTQVDPRFYKQVEELEEDREKLMAGSEAYEKVITRKDGSISSYYLESVSMEFPDGPAVVSFCSDITARKQVEKRLQESNEKLATWVNELEERNREMAQLSEMGELLQSCQVIEEVYSVSAKFVQKLFSGVQGSLYLINNSREMVEEVAKWGESQSSERLFLPSDCWALRRGRLHLVSAPNFGLLCQHITNPQAANYLCVPMLAHGEALGVLYLQYGLNEPEAEKYFDEHRQHLAAAVADHVALALANLKLREALRQQAIRDLLTGLFNRRYMEESLERELRRAERGGTSVGVIMSDIDKFKEFNDLFGHDGGDTLLRDLGAFLKKRMRGEDIVCRYGGEEFVFVLPDATMESTRKWAEELRRAVKELRVFHFGKPLGPIAMSFGVAVFPEHGSTVEKILNRVDIALYRAKNEGRDRVIIASQEE